MDGLDAASVGEAVAAAGPDAIVHQITGLSEAHAGKRPGAWDEQLELVRKRLFPLVGGGTASATKPKPSQSAVPSGRGWHRLRLVGVHVDDAASAAVLAEEQNAKGCSTSSTTSRPPSASGFRSSRSAPGPGRRDEFPRG
jgi:hypothetical protein